MSLEQVKDELRQDVERLKRLHDRLGDSGEPLSTTDKEDIRQVLSGRWLRAMQSEMRIFFTEGLTEDLDHSAQYIASVLRQFS